LSYNEIKIINITHIGWVEMKCKTCIDGELPPPQQESKPPSRPDANNENALTLIVRNSIPTIIRY